MTVSAKFDLKLQIDETLVTGLDHAEDPEITHTIADDSGTLEATSDPPASKAWSGKITLAGGAGSIDLTALDRGSLLADEDLTGLKVQLVKLSCPTTNSNPITVQRDAGGSGYNFFGADKSGAEKITLAPGDVYELKRNDSAADVAAAEKVVAFAGTGTDAISVQLVAG